MQKTNTMEIKEFRKIINHLEEIAERESKKLFRLAWKATYHNCSQEIIDEIRAEARELHMIGRPEKLLDTRKTWKYAFR